MKKLILLFMLIGCFISAQESEPIDLDSITPSTITNIFKYTQAEYATFDSDTIYIEIETIFKHEGFISYVYTIDGKKIVLLSTNFKIIQRTRHNVEYVLVGKLDGTLFYSAIIELKN